MNLPVELYYPHCIYSKTVFNAFYFFIFNLNCKDCTAKISSGFEEALFILAQNLHTNSYSANITFDICCVLN